MKKVRVLGVDEKTLEEKFKEYFKSLCSSSKADKKECTCIEADLARIADEHYRKECLKTIRAAKI